MRNFYVSIELKQPSTICCSIVLSSHSPWDHLTGSSDTRKRKRSRSEPKTTRSRLAHQFFVITVFDALVVLRSTIIFPVTVTDICRSLNFYIVCKSIEKFDDRRHDRPLSGYVLTSFKPAPESHLTFLFLTAGKRL